MKFLIIFAFVALIAVVRSGSPEQWSNETYEFIKGFKGDKSAFKAAFTLRCMKEAPKMKKLPKEDLHKGIELLYGKFTGSEVISVDELKAFFADMMKMMPKN